MMKRLVPSLAISVQLLSACAVEPAQVAARPPELGRPDVVVAQRESGTLRLESASLFFWPISSDSNVNKRNVASVGRLSNEIDQLQVQMASVQAGLVQDSSDWMKLECARRFAVVPEGQDPSGLSEIENWRDVAGADPETQRLYAECRANQSRRLAALPERDRLLEEQRVRVEKIYTIIDPGYPNQVENLVQVNSRGSLVRIFDREVRDGVREAAVVLRDFVFEGHRREDLKAEYRTRSRSLVFRIPEWSQDKAPTGRVFEFELGRNSDFLGFARWTGDFRLVGESGQIVKVGSAKFEGVLN